MIEVVTAAKLMTDVVTAVATTIIAAPSVARRRKGKGILVEEPKPLKKQAQIEQDEAYARELEAELNKNINWDDVIEQVKRKEKEDNMDFFKGMSYDEIRPIFEKYFNSNVAFLEKSEKELEEEASMTLKRKGESSKGKAAKKQKLDEEVEELKKHLQIVPNDEDDVYTEATPLALKVPVVDYQIHTENNKPHYKIIRADRTHQLFLSFIILLRNFVREELEMLWQIVQERFASAKPNKFLDDFMLATLKAMLESLLLKLKFRRTKEAFMMILLIERRYPLTRFTLDQMLNNVRLEVEEETEVSLELLRFVRRQQQEGYRPDFRVDDVEDFKEYTLRDYYR
nr:hypothetical protein [Tanacetum cinerariifolium]